MQKLYYGDCPVLGKVLMMMLDKSNLAHGPSDVSHTCNSQPFSLGSSFGELDIDFDST